MRKLTIRERVLIGILAVLAVVCAYVFLFYLPMEEEASRLNGRIQESTDLLAQTYVMAEQQDRMERELETLRTEGTAMPDYDNIQSVMVELNRILDDSREYTLRFSSAQAEDRVMARQVTLPFTCSSYASAKAILQSLHDSALRCQLEDVAITQGAGGAVQVNATVIFYEYQTRQPEADG